MHNPNDNTNGTPGTLTTIAMTHGLPPGGKLREAQMVDLTPTGLVFRGPLTLERWQELMRSLKLVKEKAVIYMADGIRAGNEWFGEEVVRGGLVQMEFEAVDVQHAVGIASLADGVRHESLSEGHYWVLAKLGLDADAQRKWSALAVEHGLSPTALMKSIEAKKIVKLTAGGGSSSLATIHGVAQLFETWFSNAGKATPIEKMNEAHARELWAELEGPTRYGAALAAKLGIKLEGEVGK